MQAFGTDGEKALAEAFSQQFHYAVHLTCFLHCRRNIKGQLQTLNYPEHAIREVLDDIFSCQQGNVLSEGLVDSANEEDFSQKISVLEKRWGDLEKAHNAHPGLFEWFIQNK